MTFLQTPSLVTRHTKKYSSNLNFSNSLQNTCLVKQLKDFIFLNTLDAGFSGLDGAGTCPDNEKVRITQMYLCNANKIK